MTTPTDRDFIAGLRSRTETALSEMSLDALAIRAAGRRATRARRWVVTGVGVTMLAAVMVAGGARSVLTAARALSPAAQTHGRSLTPASRSPPG